MGIFKNAYMNSNEEMMPYFYWLASLNVIGIKTYIKLQSYFGSPKEIFYSSNERLARCKIFTKSQFEIIKDSRSVFNPEKEYEAMLRKNVKMIIYESDEYPKRLREIAGAPIALFLIGKMPDEKRPVVSVIGARECTQYGRVVAAALGEAMADNSISLVSGMARGIDSCSQEAIIKAGGYSLAVLGGGPDYIYPKESRGLYEALKASGGIISEYAPGVLPRAQFFAMRNRIISGLSDVVCVVEAREKSGTMITVDAALEQGREVYVVPGKITDITSKGCNELIKQGAGIVTDIKEFTKEISERFELGVKAKSPGLFTGKDGHDSEETSVKPDDELIAAKESLTENEKRILLGIKGESFIIDDIAFLTGISTGDILAECISLYTKGMVENKGAGRFQITSFGINIRNLLLLINQNTYI